MMPLSRDNQQIVMRLGNPTENNICGEIAVLRLQMSIDSCTLLIVQ